MSDPIGIFACCPQRRTLRAFVHQGPYFSTFGPTGDALTEAHYGFRYERVGDINREFESETDVYTLWQSNVSRTFYIPKGYAGLTGGGPYGQLDTVEALAINPTANSSLFPYPQTPLGSYYVSPHDVDPNNPHVLENIALAIIESVEEVVASVNDYPEAMAADEAYWTYAGWVQTGTDTWQRDHIIFHSTYDAETETYTTGTITGDFGYERVTAVSPSSPEERLTADWLSDLLARPINDPASWEDLMVQAYTDTNFGAPDAPTIAAMNAASYADIHIGMHIRSETVTIQTQTPINTSEASERVAGYSIRKPVTGANQYDMTLLGYGSSWLHDPNLAGDGCPTKLTLHQHDLAVLAREKPAGAKRVFQAIITDYVAGPEAGIRLYRRVDSGVAVIDPDFPNEAFAVTKLTCGGSPKPVDWTIAQIELLISAKPDGFILLQNLVESDGDVREPRDITSDGTARTVHCGSDVTFVALWSKITGTSAWYSARVPTPIGTHLWVTDQFARRCVELQVAFEAAYPPATFPEYAPSSFTPSTDL